MENINFNFKNISEIRQLPLHKAKEIKEEHPLFNFKILLNSGDEILVTAKDLTYTEEDIM